MRGKGGEYGSARDRTAPRSHPAGACRRGARRVSDGGAHPRERVPARRHPDVRAREPDVRMCAVRRVSRANRGRCRGACHRHGRAGRAQLRPRQRLGLGPGHRLQRCGRHPHRAARGGRDQRRVVEHPRKRRERRARHAALGRRRADDRPRNRRHRRGIDRSGGPAGSRSHGLASISSRRTRVRAPSTSARPSSSSTSRRRRPSS